MSYYKDKMAKIKMREFALYLASTNGLIAKEDNCPICGKLSWLERHHWYSEDKLKVYVMLICHNCRLGNFYTAPKGINDDELELKLDDERIVELNKIIKGLKKENRELYVKFAKIKKWSKGYAEDVEKFYEEKYKKEECLVG